MQYFVSIQAPAHLTGRQSLPNSQQLEAQVMKGEADRMQEAS